MAKRDTGASARTGARKPSSKATNARQGKQAKAAATKAAEVARAAGAKGRADKGGMTRLEKRMRDTAILLARHAGESTKAIAREWEITPRSVERVLADFRLAGSPLDQRPAQLLEEVAKTYRRQMADFGRMVAANVEKNPSVALGAMKASVDALERYVDLMADVGKLPENLELFRSEAELARFTQEMSRRVQALAAGQITVGELVAFFRENTIASSAVVEAEHVLELEADP